MVTDNRYISRCISIYIFMRISQKKIRQMINDIQLQASINPPLILAIKVSCSSPSVIRLIFSNFTCSLAYKDCTGDLYILKQLLSGCETSAYTEPLPIKSSEIHRFLRIIYHTLLQHLPHKSDRMYHTNYHFL